MHRNFLADLGLNIVPVIVFAIYCHFLGLKNGMTIVNYLEKGFEEK